MSATPAMIRCLKLVAKHGAADRVWKTAQVHDYRWMVRDEIMTRHVGTALVKGWMVGVGPDQDRAVLTDRGRAIVHHAA